MYTSIFYISSVEFAVVKPSEECMDGWISNSILKTHPHRVPTITNTALETSFFAQYSFVSALDSIVSALDSIVSALEMIVSEND